MKKIQLFFYLLPLLICTVGTWAEDTGKPAKPESGGGLLLYVGLFNAQAVNIYQSGQNQGPVNLILDGVSNITGDIVVDSEQHVYVTYSSGWVSVYPRGGLVPGLRYQFRDLPQPTLTDGLAVGSDGTLYAALWNQGEVAEYQKGKPNRASLLIRMPGGTTAYAVAVDSQNNLYAEYGAPSFPQPGHIEKCLPGSSQCTDQGITLGAPGSHLIVDSQGNLIACDQLAGHIDVFPPGGTLPRVISQGLVGCPFFALNQAETQLFVANQPHSGANQGISVFDYASGKLLRTITTGIPADDFMFGVAVSPAGQ